MEASNNKQPTEEEIWSLRDANPRGEEWPERLITWNPKEYYTHGIGSGYRAKNSFEWLFHFIQDKGFTKHKKERVLRILFKYKGRQVKKVQDDPVVFVVVSEPEHERKDGMWEMAHVYRVMIDRWGRFFCPCEWNMTTSLETCTHILSVRGYILNSSYGGVRETQEIQRESQICTH